MCPYVVLGALPAAIAVLVLLERRRAQKLIQAQVENDRLRIRLERLSKISAIDAEIDGLDDDQLVERMRNSPYLRK